MKWLMRCLCQSIPHACGGEPVMGYFSWAAEGIPHACGGEPVTWSSSATSVISIPHACGGEPEIETVTLLELTYSPRVWG